MPKAVVYFGWAAEATKLAFLRMRELVQHGDMPFPADADSAVSVYTSAKMVSYMLAGAITPLGIGNHRDERVFRSVRDCELDTCHLCAAVVPP